MKKILKFLPSVSLLAFLPAVAFAASGAADILGNINNLLSAILPLLVSLGVLYFIWGVVQYVINDNEEAKTKGRDRIIFGIIGLAVIISVWGLVYLLASTLGVGQDAAPNLTNLVTTQTGSSFGKCQSPFMGNKTFAGLLDYVTCTIGESVIPFLFAIAMVMFVWGVVNFIFINADEEAKRAQGKQFMIWGIIALTVMISVWGLVNIVGGTFGIDSGFLPSVKP